MLDVVETLRARRGEDVELVACPIQCVLQSVYRPLEDLVVDDIPLERLYVVPEEQDVAPERLVLQGANLVYVAEGPPGSHDVLEIVVRLGNPVEQLHERPRLSRPARAVEQDLPRLRLAGKLWPFDELDGWRTETTGRRLEAVVGRREEVVSFERPLVFHPSDLVEYLVQLSEHRPFAVQLPALPEVGADDRILEAFQGLHVRGRDALPQLLVLLLRQIETGGPFDSGHDAVDCSLLVVSIQHLLLVERVDYRIPILRFDEVGQFVEVPPLCDVRKRPPESRGESVGRFVEVVLEARLPPVLPDFPCRVVRSFRYPGRKQTEEHGLYHYRTYLVDPNISVGTLKITQSPVQTSPVQYLALHFQVRPLRHSPPTNVPRPLPPELGRRHHRRHRDAPVPARLRREQVPLEHRPRPRQGRRVRAPGVVRAPLRRRPRRVRGCTCWWECRRRCCRSWDSGCNDVRTTTSITVMHHSTARVDPPPNFLLLSS